ncbi:MAG: hemolysin family protein [Chloroflexi bacterium]|nr:hemolysin family protein [Chloroflexota bacterium]MCY3697739.1 hemolysin family protein [Chloroflexota bacterium]MXX81744.1 HlyC/CorC family transporter [Chloroflexota bacterium]MYB21930.1 HlyC/CorC family transporter [Chloroflexota bacterium]MYF21225.1 HlyC/CorC family transporter [Chloroflexota bacterium]
MSEGSIIALVILILAVTLLVLEAIAEAGVISLSRSRAQLLASRQPDNRRAQRLTVITAERERALGSFAVGRTVAVASGFTAIFYIVIRETGFQWEWLCVTGVVSAVVAALTQSVPRRLAATWPEGFALNFVPIIDLLDAVFLIPAAILEAPARLVTGLGRRHTEVAPQPTDIEVLIEQEHETIAEDEREMIRGIMTIGDRIVREAMTPRLDIAALAADTDLTEAANFLLERGFSRVPIFEESIDNITGIVYAKDLMAEILNEGDRSVATIARPPILVPESKLIDDLLHDLRGSRVHMAIVLDEYGGTAGLITLEDILEEIVGEIADEYDPAGADDDGARMVDDALILDGRAPLGALEQIGGHVEAADYDTVAGLVFDRLGRIPEVGDEVRLGNLTVVVERMNGRRVIQMRAMATAAPLADSSDEAR